MRSEFCTFDAELSTVNSQQGLCLEMQTHHQECPPGQITPLECTDTRYRRAPALESTLTNSLDLKSPGIRASWPFRGAEVLWRSATAITPLECTLTKNGLITPLECTDTNSLDLKSFRFHSYKNPRGACFLASLPPCFLASLLPILISTRCINVPGTQDR